MKMKTITPDTLTSASAAPQHQQQQPQHQQQLHLQQQHKQHLAAIIPQQQHITPVIMEATAHVNLVDDDDEKDPLALEHTAVTEAPQEQQQTHNSTLANKHTHSLRLATCL